jgi:hypothetical protein
MHPGAERVQVHLQDLGAQEVMRVRAGDRQLAGHAFAADRRDGEGCASFHAHGWFRLDHRDRFLWFFAGESREREQEREDETDRQLVTHSANDKLDPFPGDMRRITTVALFLG